MNNCTAVVLKYFEVKQIHGQKFRDLCTGLGILLFIVFLLYYFLFQTNISLDIILERILVCVSDLAV